MTTTPPSFGPAAMLAIAIVPPALAQTSRSVQPSIQPGLPEAGSTRSPSAGLDEGAAKSKLESEGYCDIRGMTSNPDGSWKAKAIRDNSQLDIVFDSGGTIKSG